MRLSSISLFIFIFFNHLPMDSYAQNLLANPSYEGTVGFGVIAPDWFWCNNSPDITSGYCCCSPASINMYDGNTALGIRSNESVGQILSTNIEKDTLYYFSCYVAVYGGPVCTSYGFKDQIEFWLGSSSCDEDTLILLTDSLVNTVWMKIEIEFTSWKSYSNFKIKNRYGGFDFPYNYIDNFCLRKKTSYGSCTGETIVPPEPPIDPVMKKINKCILIEESY